MLLRTIHSIITELFWIETIHCTRKTDLTLWRPSWASECPDVKNFKWRLNPAWHRMLYSCTHVAPLGVKGLMCWVCNVDYCYKASTWLVNWRECSDGVIQARLCRKKRCSRWSSTTHCRVNLILTSMRSCGLSCHVTSLRFSCKGELFYQWSLSSLPDLTLRLCYCYRGWYLHRFLSPLFSLLTLVSLLSPTNPLPCYPSLPQNSLLSPSRRSEVWQSKLVWAPATKAIFGISGALERHLVARS